MTASIFDGQAGIGPPATRGRTCRTRTLRRGRDWAVYSRQQGGSTVSDERARLESMEATRPARLSERLRLGGRNDGTPHGEPSQLQDLVVISGFSGAGKSTAMHLFEDAGYFCVDNLPPEMIRHLADLFVHEGSKVEKAAVVSDVRGGDYFDGLLAVLEGLTRSGVAHRLLFLDADEQTLLTRFKETRRRHPLAPTGSVADGIEAERQLLGPLKERAQFVIDTTGLKASQLRRRIADEMLPTSTPGKLAVTFTSFGHKHGPPRDADLSFDVRFLPNPHYEARLRPLTGSDPRIVAYVNRGGELEAFYGRLIPLLDYLLPQYVAEGKAHLNVAIGCTGGRHRSVVIAEHLATLYGRRGEYLVEVSHRDVDKQRS
jgi:RNase adapter protein RapZ